MKSVLSVALLLAIGGFLAVNLPGAVRAAEATAPQMRHYKSDEWKFELDIPRRWFKQPPRTTVNRPEIMRFVSVDNGDGLIIVRGLYDPKNQTPGDVIDQFRQQLSKGGASSFVPGETTIGSRRVFTLEYTERHGKDRVLKCRHYFVFDGALWYLLGFSTTDSKVPYPLFDRVAKSFIFENS